MTGNTIELADNKSFFEKALFLGVKQGKITAVKVQEILLEGSEGIIQIAQVFSTPYLRPGLESARDRMVALVSLYLEHESQGSVDRAIDLINQREFLDLSKGGSDMIKKLGGVMEVDEVTSREDAINNAYALFSKPLPWNKGGIFRKYQAQLREQLSIQRKLLFIKNLLQLTGIKSLDASGVDIPNDIFLPVITGRKMASESSEMLQLGKYDKKKWEDLIAKLDSEFGELSKEYSFQNCMGLLLERGRFMARNDLGGEGDDMMNEEDTGSEWHLLFPAGEKHTMSQYMTAALTGAIDGKMKKTITLSEFMKICEKARKQGIQLSMIEEYISKNAQPSLDIYAIIIDRIDRDWRDMLGMRSPINRRMTALKSLIQHMDILNTLV